MNPETTQDERRLPIGAELRTGGGVGFRVWAPKRRRVAVVLEHGRGAGAVVELTAEADGYFSGVAPAAGAGTRYRFRLDGEAALFPDPASRFQPEGPHGASEVIDPDAFAWSDAAWEGVEASRHVVYELHVGTLTPEGTWDAARALLPALADVGITTLEVMPVAAFPGAFGWGYDGVDFFAPTQLYGTPNDFRRFVDAAHGAGLAVILDVVYNHFGPAGNYLPAFSDAYISHRYNNEWGDAVNFDGEDSAPVREFFISNAGYWIDEFHLDGLRLDATQGILDASPVHVVTEIAARVRQAARHRRSWVVGENEPQHVWLLAPPAEGGGGLDALWNDDFHHSAFVAATGHRDAYLSDYLGEPQELVSTVKRGFLYQGQWYARQHHGRGTPTRGLAPSRFVDFLQNHDQVANTPGGRRLHQETSPGRWRALTTLLLLAPQIPMLFQGEEFAATTPFYFFADHEPELAAQVRRGRTEFVRQFAAMSAPGAEQLMPDPADPETFQRSKLSPAERERNTQARALHRDLLRLRREDPVLSARPAAALDGAVVGPEALVLRWFGEAGADRLLLLNLGRDVVQPSIAEPLVAPPERRRWTVLWASEHPRYGGSGSPDPQRKEGWHVLGHAAVLLAPEPVREEAHA